jgi:hypothetical protein
MNLPSPSVQDGAMVRLQAHAKERFVGKNGVKEIRGTFKTNHLFLEVVKEEKGGLVGKMFGGETVRGVGRLARLDYLGPNKWKLLIYKPDTISTNTAPIPT